MPFTPPLFDLLKYCPRKISIVILRYCPQKISVVFVILKLNPHLFLVPSNALLLPDSTIHSLIVIVKVHCYSITVIVIVIVFQRFVPVPSSSSMSPDSTVLTIPNIPYWAGAAAMLDQVLFIAISLVLCHLDP